MRGTKGWESGLDSGYYGSERRGIICKGTVVRRLVGGERCQWDWDGSGRTFEVRCV
jgi:hypothetical protein